jgi:uncharacterized membrane protein
VLPSITGGSRGTDFVPAITVNGDIALAAGTLCLLLVFIHGVARSIQASNPPRPSRTTPRRDMGQDLGYGIRRLTDIALRALSPAVNDPTTAVTCIGYLGACLERLVAVRAEGPPRRAVLRRGPAGAVQAEEQPPAVARGLLPGTRTRLARPGAAQRVRRV